MQIFFDNNRDTNHKTVKMRSRDAELSKGWGQIVTPLWTNTNWWRQKLNYTNTKWILRIIQSIPSPKAEPFKQRLASLGNDRVEEINDPELWIARARARAMAVYKSKVWQTKIFKGELVLLKPETLWQMNINLDELLV